jgi:hypothetical protein
VHAAGYDGVDAAELRGWTIKRMCMEHPSRHTGELKVAAL